MNRLLAPGLSLALASALSLSALGQEPSVAHPAVARVEVLAGRAVVHTEVRAEQTLLRAGRAVVEGPAHLEVGAGSEVRLSWAGRASFHLWGPAAIQWRSIPATEGSASGLSSYSEERLEWRLFDLTWADLEVRRGSHHLYLPDDWRMSCDSGAWQFRRLPSGPLELRHHAGSPVTLTWLGDPARARPPITVYSGSSLRIDRPQPSAQDRSEGYARAWPQSSWPWRRATDTPRQRLQRAQRAQHEGRTADLLGQDSRAGRRAERLPDTSASLPVTPEALTVQVERRALPSPTSGTQKPAQPIPDQGGPASRRLDRKAQSPAWGPVTRRVDPARDAARDAAREAARDAGREAARDAGRATDGEPTPDPVPEPEPEPRPAPAPDGPYPFDARHWRGLSRNQLNAVGPLAIQRSTGVEVRVFRAGRRKVLVDVLSSEGIWCFTPLADYLLAPGAVAVFEADGSLGTHFGDVRRQPSIPGRPSPSQLEN